MSTSSLTKHMTKTTSMSLNDRFTAISSDVRAATAPNVAQRRAPQRNRSRSRSRSYAELPPLQREASKANQRLLNELAKRHTVQAALKIKRRSMRTAVNGNAIRRGSIKALRLAPNGRPIRTNSLTKVATMQADNIANNNRGILQRRRRADSTNRNFDNRLGPRRPTVGGAAERIQRRRFERMRGRSAQRAPQMAAATAAVQQRGRSRSRSRGRQPANPVARGGRPIPLGRGRSRSRSRGRLPNIRAQALNRGRPRNALQNNVGGRQQRISIKDRLGVRPGATVGNARNIRNNMRANSKLRGVTNGRVQKRRNSNVAQQTIGGAAAGGGGRVSRPRGRSAVRAAANAVAAGNAGRSRSRSRGRAVGNGGVGRGGRGGQQQRSNANNSVGRGRNAVGGGNRRGRSQQRNGGVGSRNGNGSVQNKNVRNARRQQGGQQQQQTQQRRGRSRSRQQRGGAGGGRNLGKGNNNRPQVNKDELDQELDQYMATTKTENDVDYLLKN